MNAWQYCAVMRKKTDEKYLQGRHRMKMRYLALAGTAIGLFLAFRFFLPLTMPFVLAYFFAKLVSPIVHFLVKRMKWRRKVSIILVVVTVFLVLGGFTVYIISLVISQGMLLLQKIPVYQQMFGKTIEQLCCHCDQMLELSVGTSFQYVEAQVSHLYRNIGSDVLPRLSGYATELLQWLAAAVSGIFIFFLSTTLILLDDTFPKMRGKLQPFMRKLKGAGFAYIKAQVLLLFIIAALLCFGLFFMGNEYAVLLGIGIAIFDAFPIMGSGVVLIPWALLSIVGKHYYEAAILLTIFCIITFLREILEPRLLGKEVGLKPLYILISVYVGIQLFGVIGVILGPISLTILKAVDEELRKKEEESPGPLAQN